VIEFLIKRVDGDWFDLAYERFPVVLCPDSVPSEPIEGWGDHRISVMGCEVSFSYEDPGIQVCFETGNISEAMAVQLVEEIAAKVRAATGQQTTVIPL
jgi:hypothetical protein